MAEANPISSPMASTCKLSKVGSNVCEDVNLYRSIVSALQYATLIHPEVSFSVNKVCQFMSNPLDNHWRAVKRILRYLQGVATHGLLLSPAHNPSFFPLYVLCDADWASDLDNRRSTLGYCIFLGLTWCHGALRSNHLRLGQK